MDITDLQAYLDGVFPVGARFCTALAPIMYPHSGFHKQDLLLPPARAMFAWFLLKGIVVASVRGRNGKEIVLRIYRPPVVFSDLTSFLQGRASTIRLTVIGSAELQKIGRQDFLAVMMPFSETQMLKEGIILGDQLKDTERSVLLDMPEAERFEEFAGLYPVNQLPNITAASYLNMSTTKYCNLKAAWNSRSWGR